LPLGGSFVWVCLYPLVLGSLLQTTRWRRRALAAFAVAVLLTLIISCGMSLGVFPQRALVHTQPNMVDTVFKEYTQQGLALLIFLSMALSASLVTRSRRDRYLLLASVLLGLINIVFMIESRTTYITLIALAGFWTWRLCMRNNAGWRYILMASGLGLAALTTLLLLPAVRTRLVDSLTSETELYLQHHDPTSTGVRLELWRKTLPIVESAPIFGHGLHQWAPLYKKSIEGTRDMHGFLMGHPHQEMLLILAEQGAAGLLVYLILLVALYRYIRRLDDPERDIYLSILLIYIVAGLANGLWADFTHRNVFVLLLACIPLVNAKVRTETALHEPGR
jgi:O-antigen ligase